jgi:hypothetical protein
VLSDLTPDPALTPRVHAAIDVIRKADPTYWEKCCNLCDPRVQGPLAGGVLDLRTGYTGTVEAALRACEWSAFDHPGVPSTAKAFRTFDLQGWMGTLSERLVKAPYVTAIIGPGEGSPECMWYFHPGPPTTPETRLLASRRPSAILSPEEKFLRACFGAAIVDDTKDKS